MPAIVIFSQGWQALYGAAVSSAVTHIFVWLSVPPAGQRGGNVVLGGSSSLAHKAALF